MKHLRVLKHLFKRVPRHFWLHWNFEVKKGKNPSTWRMVHASNEIENKALCLESLSIWECSWNFQPEILPKMERALGVSFENCHRKHLAVVWSKMGVHWQNWSWWPSHQTNWTCCGPVLPLVQTCITCFFLDTCHTLIHYHDPKQVKLKFGTKTYTPAGILPAFLTFYQLCFRVDFPLLSATPLDTSLNLN